MWSSVFLKAQFKLKIILEMVRAIFISRAHILSATLPLGQSGLFLWAQEKVLCVYFCVLGSGDKKAAELQRQTTRSQLLSDSSHTPKEPLHIVHQRRP